eukprot:scaffold76181_cov66-Phaeocystis_antarctica.AAC.1
MVAEHQHAEMCNIRKRAGDTSARERRENRYFCPLVGSLVRFLPSACKFEKNHQRNGSLIVVRIVAASSKPNLNLVFPPPLTNLTNTVAAQVDAYHS